ncbi:tRNA (adenosine(37)-N6)-dimethylallyltransferase MiaA [Gordonia rhizosphera]|uniref:tRNA dimethylallyltransferase n=1 Tax=Gordonia rhizosphera NBRC 16068 TaxID=1108045 RepID=K6W3P7_9ACTN|nr:tRNA (adenosine(37)-N6)-dimethylallyltransferase MiaA [Gordonia rhizosphera]GAB88316.1 tRNA dimethylallyltransferase [Gordonia rhizosphera NBRC 16068]
MTRRPGPGGGTRAPATPAPIAPVPIAIVGPTAAGKSDLALDVAERLHGEIVNLDAMQQYRGMDIGTAKLPVGERRGIPHHQIDVLDVTATATVARYQQAASADVERLLAEGITPVLAGGSMMYIQGLLDNWQFPATDPDVRARYEAMLDEVGVGQMHRHLAEVDPQAAASILDTDGRRIVRALEVVELTGQPFAASAPSIGEPRWGTRLIAVDRDTAALDERIRLRTRQMFAGGLADEVRALCEVGLREGRTASRAIGYAQVLAALDGEYDMDTAEELTFIGTRRYVRRQRSWFRRDHRIVWLDAADPDLTGSTMRAIGE